jgi:hypothetical protein
VRALALGKLNDRTHFGNVLKKTSSSTQISDCCRGKNECCALLSYETVQHGRWKHTLQTKLPPSSTLKRYSEDSMALRNICSPVIDHALLRHRRPRSGRLNYFHLLDVGFSNYYARTATGTPTTVYWYTALFKNSIHKRG